MAPKKKVPNDEQYHHTKPNKDLLSRFRATPPSLHQAPVIEIFFRLQAYFSNSVNTTLYFSKWQTWKISSQSISIVEMDRRICRIPRNLPFWKHAPHCINSYCIYWTQTSFLSLNQNWATASKLLTLFRLTIWPSSNHICFATTRNRRIDDVLTQNLSRKRQVVSELTVLATCQDLAF